MSQCLTSHSATRVGHAHQNLPNFSVPLRVSAVHRLTGAAPQGSAARSLRPRPVDPQQPAPVPTSASPTAPPTSPTPPGTIPSPSVHCPNSSESTT
nr:hypothetical protein Iba_chr05cCG14190 [Ipomoea batatas]